MVRSLPTFTLFSKPLFFLLVCSLFLGIGSLRSQGGGCVCTNCPQFMPDLFVGSFYINVQNASNPTLGQNGQGVCGVKIHFDHTAICDISMTLTSPSGQTVTLVAPIGQFCSTLGNTGTDWDVTFLPCGDAVSPDPGFSDTWNNNQNWGGNNNYTGSYYPYAGCLENFTGPVNGTWNLTVTDGQANDVGNLYNYEIIFCDPSGIECYSCAANAGFLPQNDVVECEGDPGLSLDLPPAYLPPLVAPPASDYSYAYVIGGAGGVIQAIQTTPDLTAFPGGTYTVCGLSYLTANADDIPDPNGTLTVTQLTNQLNSTQPPFCGDVTTNCVGVTIKPVPPDVEESVEICVPDCYYFYNQDFCQSGTYVLNLTENGCPYVATLNLTVRQPDFVTVFETICAGGCSVNPLFPYACNTGTYQETVDNIFGCDSTVTLNLTVIDPVAVIQPPPILACGQPSAQLSGTGSSAGGGTTYLWTAANGGTIIGAFNGLNVTIGTAGNYSLEVCRTFSGRTCCDTATVTVTSDTSVPATPANIIGDSTICFGLNGTYSIPAVPGATGYTWTVPAGVIIDSGQNTTSIVISWDSLNTGNICVTANNACGTSIPACLNITINPMPAAPVITGDSTLCPGDTGTYSIVPVNGAGGYTWTIPTGGILVSGQNTTAIAVDWTAAPGGNVCVAAGSGCGTGPQQCFPVLVNPAPVANAGADGAVCGTVFTLNATSGFSGSTGVWTTLTGPGTVNFANAFSDSTSAAASQNGLYLFQWTETNAGCTDTDTVQVSFNASPVAGIVTETCDVANENYSVTIPLSGGLAPYIVNGVPVAGNNYVSAPIMNGVSYSFTIVDANGCAAPAIAGVFSCNCATDAGQMNLQTLSACEGDSIAAQLLGGENLDANDTAAYVLHSGSGAALGVVFAQNHSGVFGFQPGMSYGVTYYVSHVVGNNVNSFPDPFDPCFSVAEGQPVVFYAYPVAMAGTDDAVCGVALNLHGNGTGVWSLASAPAGGSLSIADAQNPATSVTASQPGVYMLTWTVSLNNCTATDQVEIQFNESPSLVGLQRDCDAANEYYTVTLTITGGAAPYSVNGTPVAGATFISAAIPNGDPYTFAVADANGCFMPPVSGAYSCNCATDAGTLSTQTLFACEGSTVSAQSNNDQTLDGNDVTAYVLHSGAGPALGQVFDQNASGIFGFQPGMTLGQTYYISLVAGNGLNGLPDPAEPCFSVATGQPVVFLQTPAPEAGADAATCGQVIDLQATISGFPGVWTQVSGAGNALFAAPDAPNSAVSVSMYGDYVFVWTETNNICTDADSVQVTFHEMPGVVALDEICDPTYTQYSVTFNALGGTAPYTVSGLNGTFTGNMFTSAPVVNGSAYSFVVTDFNGCVTESIAGSHDCFCFTDAGNMITTPAVFCADTPASATWNNNPSLDGNDLVQFILHNQAGGIIGAVYATNSQPVFNFTGGLQTGTTYYISAIAGNNLAGAVDLNDPCLSVSPGTPVQWKPMPTATLTGDATICAGSSTVLTFAGTGTYPLQLTYSDGGPGNSTLTIVNSQAVNVSIAPSSDTTFTLLSVADSTNPVCTTLLSQAVSITVNQPVSAGTPTAPLELCAGEALTISLATLLTDAEAGGQWSEISTVPSLPDAFNAATGTFVTGMQPAGTYSFKYLVPALAPCPDATAVVALTILPLPNADAGADKTLNCNNATVSLGGPGTTGGAHYQWLLNTTPVGTSNTLQTGDPGNYSLVVTSAAGCSDTDVVAVLQDLEVPVAFAISKTDVHCYGEDNGRIWVDSIVSSHPPVLVALNQGAFSPQTEFYPLPAGNYTISLQDANGCEWESAPVTVAQPPELIVELGLDIVVTLGEEAVVQAGISVPLTMLDTIDWTPLLDSLHAGMPVQQFLPLASQKIAIRVVDTNGCVAGDRVTLVVKKLRQVYIPNIIRPDSDINNFLSVYGGPDVEEIEVLQIFDRWGEKLFEATHFEANDPAVQWAGKFNGQDVGSGVYVYYAVVQFIDGEQLILEGDVTVLR